MEYKELPGARKHREHPGDIKELGDTGNITQTEAMNGRRQEGKQRLSTQTLKMRGGRGGGRPGEVTRGGCTEEKTLTDRGRQTATGNTLETLKGQETQEGTKENLRTKKPKYKAQDTTLRHRTKRLNHEPWNRQCCLVFRCILAMYCHFI